MHEEQFKDKIFLQLSVHCLGRFQPLFLDEHTEPDIHGFFLFFLFFGRRLYVYVDDEILEFFGLVPDQKEEVSDSED